MSVIPSGTVTVTVSQADPSNPDVTATPASLTFTTSNWRTPKTVTVSAAHDDDVADEQATLTHTVSGGGYDSITGADSITVADVIVSVSDDDPEVTVGFGAASYTVDEGATAQVTVNLSADPTRTVIIPISLSGQGGATAADYSGAPANVTFSSGQTEQTFSFSLTDDTDDDDGESVRLSFGALPDGVSAGSIAQTTVIITDNDGAAKGVTPSTTELTIDEGGSGTYTLKLATQPTGQVR